MKRILASCLLVLAIAGLVVSTTGADVVSHDETNVVELEPAGEGTYTLIDDETGEIQIVIPEENPNMAAAGVNPNAVTDIGPVFTIENVLTQQTNTTVWISHDSDAIEFYVPGEGLAESQADGAFMQPGDSEMIAMRIDTRETDEITIDSINVMANLDPEVEPEADSEDDPVEENLGGGGPSLFETGENDGESDGDSEFDDSSDSETGSDTQSDGDSETETPTPTASPTPMPTETPENSSTTDGTPSTDDPTGEQSGLELSSLFGVLALLVGIVTTGFLTRWFRG
jgi:hypothetical protein